MAENDNYPSDVAATPARETDNDGPGPANQPGVSESDNDAQGLVIWDAAASHSVINMTWPFINRPFINRPGVVMIPSGMTWLLQGLDTVINRPFINRRWLEGWERPEQCECCECE